MLNKHTNYIVSGLERSGTSMIMQMIHATGIPIAYDEKKQPDENNPKGYYELEGGKIINLLMKNEFNWDMYLGKVIKVTAFGLQYLPDDRKYKIIYSERKIEEVLKSMNLMGAQMRLETDIKLYEKLNNYIKNKISGRKDMNILYVNYNDIIDNPIDSSEEIIRFLSCGGFADKLIMASMVDRNLYRVRY